MVSDRTIGRLSLYRRLLDDLRASGADHTFSHELAAKVGGTAAQVRRDLMAIGYTGSPVRGYDVADLAVSIGEFLDAAGVQEVALVGAGNLGRAIMAFFEGRRPKLAITVAFDVDERKVNRLVFGRRCLPVARMREVCAGRRIQVAVIAVPADQAQAVADDLVAAGVRGILNFAPAPLHAPPGVYVEQIDMTMSLEKTAYFSRCGVETA